MTEIEFHFVDNDPSFNKNIPPFLLSSEERTAIDSHWNSVNLDGRFFNGPVLAATKMNTLPASPRLEVGMTDYAHYLYAASNPGSSTPCKNVYCAALIVTKDNRLVIGQMASRTAAPGKLQLVGGNVELSPSGEIDARECCIREISEEVGDSFASAIETNVPFCIKTGGPSQSVGLFYLAHILLTATEAQRAFDLHQEATRQRGEEPELSQLHFVALKQPELDSVCVEHAGRMVDYLAPLLSNHLEQMARIPA